MAWTEKYVTTSGTEAWATNSSSNPSSFAEAIANAAIGERVNIKAGTYTNTAVLSYATHGTTTTGIWWRGYNSTIGDLDAKPTSQLTPGTDMPLIDSTANYVLLDSNYQIVSSLAFRSNVSARPSLYARGDYVVYRRCRFENTHTSSSTAFAAYADSIYQTFEDCYFKCPTSGTAPCLYKTSTHHAFILGSVFEGGTNSIQSASILALNNCLFKNSNSDALDLTSSPNVVVENCTFYNSTGDGIQWSGGSIYRPTIRNNYFHTVGGYAINFASTGHAHISNNCYYNLTSGQINNVHEATQFDALTDSSDQFVNAAGGDFTLKQTSNGFRASSPGLFEKDGPTSFRDVGAIQHRSVADQSRHPLARF